MKKTAAILMLITLISKTFGFLRDVTLAYNYGASVITDAYLISSTVPITIFAFIGAGIIKNYIPLYNDINVQYGTKRSSLFTSNLISSLLVLSTLFVLLTFLFTEELVTVLASGFTREAVQLSVTFTKISIFSIYFLCIVSVLNGYLNLKNSYYAPGFIGVLSNLIIVFTIILSKETSIYLMPLGILFSFVVQAIFISVYAYKNGYKCKFVINIKDKFLKQYIYLSIPIILGNSVNQINVIVDRTIASNIEIGAISSLSYANTLNLFVQGVFVASISTVMYPTITRFALEKNFLKIKKTIYESTNLINLLIIPSTFGILFFSKQIVDVLFSRGAFNVDANIMTSTSLFYYSIGMVGYAHREILSRVFYSFKDTKTPVINAILGVIINVVLNIILSKYMGIGGVALATSISAIVTTSLLFYSLGKKIGNIGLVYMLKTSLKIVVASGIMLLVSGFIYSLINDTLSSFMSLGVSVFIAVSVYGVVISFMEIEEVDAIKKVAINKIIK